MTINPLDSVTTVTVQIVTLLIGDTSFDNPKTLAAFALGMMLFLVTLVHQRGRAAHRAPLPRSLRLRPRHGRLPPPRARDAPRPAHRSTERPTRRASRGESASR